MVEIFGGRLPTNGGGIVYTGAGEQEHVDWPSKGYNTCESYTSDAWDGSTPGTMMHFGSTYTCYEVKP